MAASRISAFLNSARKGLIAATITVAALAFPFEASAKTYLVNGILSATAIGYGFKNLKAKIPNASLFLMVTGLEAGGIRKSIVEDIRKRHAANPAEQFTLAGISKGADVVIGVARDVAAQGIPIRYIAIVESSGGSLPGNVQRADNFVCAKKGGLCTQRPVGGANTIPIDTGHIDMGDHPRVHNSVIANAS